MRCLYCGKELALLKRLTGGGDFCSDTHKQSYQEEYNRLALSRLLQAQKKGQQTSNSPARNAPPPPHASVALEEPLPRLVPDDAATRASAAPAHEAALTEARTEALAKPEVATDAVAVEESSTEAVVDAEAEPEPLETAGFLLAPPALAALPERTPYLESWLDPSAGPAMSDWQFQNGAFSLSPADLLSLDLRPNASPIKDQTFSADSSPQAFTSAQPDSTLSALANSKKIANTNRLLASGAIAIDIAPSLGASAAGRSLVQALGFESTVLFDDSQALELSPTAIDFPAEDSDVVVPASSHSRSTAFAQPETESGTAAPETGTEDDGPRASLEALSRLHQELVEQETTQTEEAPSGLHAEPIEAAPVEVVKAVPDEGQGADPETVEIATEEPRPAEEALKPTEEALKPAAEALKPKFATELFEISLRTFPPAKPALVGGDAFPSQIAPLLPHLKSLPLRPKIALATGYVPPSVTPAPLEAKPTTPAASAVRTPGPSKPATKPAARLTQPKQPPPSAKPVQATTAKAPEPRTPASPKTVSPNADATKQQAKPVASQPTPVHETSSAQANIPAVTPKARPVEKERGLQPAPAADAGKPAADTAKPTADEAKKDNVPSFGITQPASIPWLGSLKVKLGLAIALLVIACIYFLGWGGGKSNKPASWNPAVSIDGSGPSIIMGEGGWVEGWGGDPTGLHTGRQITIYRPSLKLSDYRLEFQGSIDAKSLGWVFRASDPDNYYAMKLMTVSSGLSTKVALFKYLVANGKQTQVGRVPIDLAVQADTVFDVRVDVRGPQFTTYIQGQQVDGWTDDQLKIGGAGFLNEREERGKVKSVSIRYLSGVAK
jgi:hypothetical protein